MTDDMENGARTRGAVPTTTDQPSRPPEHTRLSTADGWRLALDLAGFDRVPLGIRAAGPLNWSPPDVPQDGPPEPPVAVARRAVMAHERRVELDRALALARRFLAEFGDAV